MMRRSSCFGTLQVLLMGVTDGYGGVGRHEYAPGLTWLHLASMGH